MLRTQARVPVRPSGSQNRPRKGAGTKVLPVFVERIHKRQFLRHLRFRFVTVLSLLMCFHSIYGISNSNSGGDYGRTTASGSAGQAGTVG
jgi:hypothetical protein